MRVKNVTVRFGKKTVLENFSYDFPEKEITCILGPSGCGKTTLLNVVAGIVPFEGEVEKTGKTGFVFQEPTLFSHLTIERNIELVLRGEIKDKNERKRIVTDVLEKVGLSKERRSYPDTLSGGMAQRVSIARAFAYDSELLLLDEPFKGLDISLKKKIIEVFLTLYRTSRPTTIFVTHDADEAVMLADRVVVLSKEGKIVYEKTIASPSGERDLVETAPIRAEIYGAIE